MLLMFKSKKFACECLVHYLDNNSKFKIIQHKYLGKTEKNKHAIDGHKPLLENVSFFIL